MYIDVDGNVGEAKGKPVIGVALEAMPKDGVGYVRLVDIGQVTDKERNCILEAKLKKAEACCANCKHFRIETYEYEATDFDCMRSVFDPIYGGKEGHLGTKVIAQLRRSGCEDFEDGRS